MDAARKHSVQAVGIYLTKKFGHNLTKRVMNQNLNVNRQVVSIRLVFILICAKH